MNYKELINDKGMMEFVRKFVNDNRYLHLKDYFISQKTIKTIEPLGTFLGTRDVFNDLEDIAKTPPITEQKPKDRESHRKDPDLDEG